MVVDGDDGDEYQEEVVDRRRLLSCVGQYVYNVWLESAWNSS